MARTRIPGLTITSVDAKPSYEWLQKTLTLTERELAQARKELAEAEELVCQFKDASLLVTSAGDPADITPEHVRQHITELRQADAERDALKGADDGNGCP